MINNAYRKREKELRQEIVRICRLMWEKGFISGTDGNVSARLSEKSLLVTPQGYSKGFLKPEQLVVVDMERGRGEGRCSNDLSRYKLKPTAEILMHIEVYRQRPDVGAAIHAHPPITTAITIAGLSLSLPVLPEVIVTIGTVPTVPYATPSTPRCADAIRELIREYDALVLDRHGTLTVGETPFDAYMKLEKVEHLAKIIWAAYLLGKVTTLPLEEIDKLGKMRLKT